MATLTIRNVPDGLCARLVQRAAVNKRSVDSEIIAHLEQSVPNSEIDFDMTKPPPSHLFDEFMEGAEELSAYMEEQGIDPDEMIAEFKELRRQERQKRQEQNA